MDVEVLETLFVILKYHKLIIFEILVDAQGFARCLEIQGGIEDGHTRAGTQTKAIG